MNFFKITFLLLISLLLINGCDRLVENKYLSANIKDTSIKDMTQSIDDETQEKQPDFQDFKFKIPEELNQKVSLILNQNLSIKSVLCETAKKLNIDFQIDPSIDSRVIFQAHQKPFIDVLDAICDMADLRYTLTGGFVKVVKDTPYSKNYDIQFLNFSRDSENKISVATEVSSAPCNNDEKNISNSTDSTVTVKSKSDFWAELEEGIKIITDNLDKKSVKYSINKHSGIITVYGNSKVQKSIEDYIMKVKKSTSAQVLIEAKIIEVVLKNEYKRGIDWDLVGKRTHLKSNYSSYISSGMHGHGAPVSFSYKVSNVENILNALEEFGSMRTISNPRITAMNNQAAVLKVAQNHVYFKLHYDKVYSGNDTNKESVNVSSIINTVPIGLVMFVQPSIDIKNNTITLFLRPTITKLADSVNDPAVDIAIRSINSDNKSDYQPSKIPITEVREVSSVLKLNDGEIAVLGGFMEVRSSKNKSGIPFAKDLPIIGEAVSGYGIGDTIVELVILIKVKIANKQKCHQKAADIRLQRFVPDPRPF